MYALRRGEKFRNEGKTVWVESDIEYLYLHLLSLQKYLEFAIFHRCITCNLLCRNKIMFLKKIVLYNKKYNWGNVTHVGI